MRKFLALLLVFGVASFNGAIEMFAQEAEASGFQTLKQKFIEGDWMFMSLVLICGILGLAFCIERIITLNIATANTDKLLRRIDESLAAGDLEGAKEVCKSTPGPTASVLYEAFDRIQAVGDLSPSVVAGGIKVALLTTVFGLITAIILQVFYNYIVNKIDGIVGKMEESSIALVDVMANNNVFK